MVYERAVAWRISTLVCFCTVHTGIFMAIFKRPQSMIWAGLIFKGTGYIVSPGFLLTVFGKELLSMQLGLGDTPLDTKNR